MFAACKSLTSLYFMHISTIMLWLKAVFIFQGYYMYIETSSPRRQGDKARLQSSLYPPTSGRCLTFFYHMHGAGIGSLNVLLRQQNILKAPIWSASGDKGTQWNPVQVTLNSNVPYQVNKTS